MQQNNSFWNNGRQLKKASGSNRKFKQSLIINHKTSKIKLSLSDTEWMQIVRALNDQKLRGAKLSALAGARIKTGRYSKNAEKLRSGHQNKSEAAQNLINRIVEQL